MTRLSNGYTVWADSTLNKMNKQEIVQQLRQCERMLKEQCEITRNQYNYMNKLMDKITHTNKQNSSKEFGIYTEPGFNFSNNTNFSLTNEKE